MSWNWCRVGVAFLCLGALLSSRAFAQPPSAPASEGVPAAAAAPVEVKITTARREFALGQAVRTKIELKNRGKEWLTLRQVTLGDGQIVSDLTGKNVGAGKTVSWTGDVAPEMLTKEELGVARIRVQVETEAGKAQSELMLTRVEPYKVQIVYDPRPVSGGADSPLGDVRAFRVEVTARRPGVEQASIAVGVPPGWTLVDGKTPDARTLRREGETSRVSYKVLVPLAAPLGEYPVDATVVVGGRTYTARATIAVTR